MGARIFIEKYKPKVRFPFLSKSFGNADHDDLVVGWLIIGSEFVYPPCLLTKSVHIKSNQIINQLTARSSMVEVLVRSKKRFHYLVFHGPSIPVGQGLCGFNKGWSVVIQSRVKSLESPYFRSHSATQGVAKLLTRDWTTTDHSLLKPHSPWP